MQIEFEIQQEAHCTETPSPKLKILVQFTLYILLAKIHQGKGTEFYIHGENFSHQNIPVSPIITI